MAATQIQVHKTADLTALTKMERAVYTATTNGAKFAELIRTNRSERVNIGDNANPNWCELSGEKLARFKISQTLLLVYSMIGLKPTAFPDNKLQSEITRFIVNKYPEFTSENIYDAFSMAIADEYKDAVSLEHFGVMSLVYIQNVLKVYREFKMRTMAGAILKLEKSNTEIQSDRVEIAIKNDDAVKHMIIHGYNDFLSGRYQPGYLLATHYDFMSDCGLIDLTTPEKNELMAIVDARRKAQESAADTSHRRGEYFAAIRPASSLITDTKVEAIGVQYAKWAALELSVGDLDIMLQRVCYFDAVEMAKV